MCYHIVMAKIPIFMMTGYGYKTAYGVKFTKEHPYQLVDEDQVHELLADQDKFRIATADEIKVYYKIHQED